MFPLLAGSRDPARPPLELPHWGGILVDRPLGNEPPPGAFLMGYSLLSPARNSGDFAGAPAWLNLHRVGRHLVVLSRSLRRRWSRAHQIGGPSRQVFAVQVQLQPFCHNAVLMRAFADAFRF